MLVIDHQEELLHLVTVLTQNEPSIDQYYDYVDFIEERQGSCQQHVGSHQILHIVLVPQKPFLFLLFLFGNNRICFFLESTMQYHRSDGILIALVFTNSLGRTSFVFCKTVFRLWSQESMVFKKERSQRYQVHYKII